MYILNEAGQDRKGQDREKFQIIVVGWRTRRLSMLIIIYVTSPPPN